MLDDQNQINNSPIGSSNKKFLVYLLVVLVALILTAGIYFIFSKMVNQPAISPEAENLIKPTAQNSLPEESDDTIPTEEDLNQLIQVVGTASQASLDSDVDGISDEDELRIGTDSNSPDSDGDGLTDWEEIDTYFTRPDVVDTDGDGYSDFEEVQAGYDPLINPDW